MAMRRILAIFFLAAVCLWAVSPALAAPGSSMGTTAVPGTSPAVKGQRHSSGESHPVVQNALTQLEHAKEILRQNAADDFEGHKAKAVQNIDQAIQQLHMALQVDKK